MKKKVLVIGDILLDNYIFVDSSKISMEAPLLIYKYNKETNSLGGASNVCKYLTSFNYQVDLIGVIGNDYSGNIIIDLLRDNNINTDYIIKDDTYKTIVKKRYASLDYKQIMRVDDEEIYNNDSRIIDSIMNLNTDYDLIIISDYRKGVITNKTFNSIVEYSKKNNIKVICDPKDDQVNYNNLYILKPNQKEIEKLVKSTNDKDIIDYKIKNNIDNIVLTLGSNGMKLFDENNNIINIPSEKVNVYDVTGAGDCVLGYLAYGVLEKKQIEESAVISNYAASIKVSKFGTQLVNKYEVYTKMNNKEINRNDLKEFSDYIRKNKKIVFTNGCFDILHSGHVDLLKKAKNLGDILILGLNSDHSIKRLKGDNRPINNEAERKSVLSALEFIDYIVVFDEDTPLNIIKDIKPDILVKGGDYKDKEVVGRDFVESYGGEVKLIDFIYDVSTTNIVNKIRGE